MSSIRKGGGGIEWRVKEGAEKREESEYKLRRKKAF
jgi:hypothetical protein